MTALPLISSVRARRRDSHEAKETNEGVMSGQADSPSEGTLTPLTAEVDISRATRTRMSSIVASFVLFLLAIIFLTLGIVGQVSARPVLESTWFFNLDLSGIYPVAFGSTDLAFVNSIARSLGLHDFYRVGLWNYCEGYHDVGITYCSPPQRLYWFNPVEILLDELLPGATITLPAQITDILDLVRLVSNIMFGLFLTGVVMCFISLFILPLALYSRWWSLPVSILTFIAAGLTTAGAALATGAFTIVRNVVTSQALLNIQASLGRQMFAFLWTATACALVGWIIQLCLICCCASRRDVRTGRRKGSRHAYAIRSLEKTSAGTERAGEVGD